MIKNVLAGLFEAVHVATLSILFTCSAWVAPLASPVRKWKGSGLDGTDTASVAGEFHDYLRSHGAWPAAVVMISIALATFLRGDMKRLLSGLRLVCGGAIMLFALWAVMGLPKDRYPTAWNCLLVATASDVVLTAFLVAGKGGGSSGAKASAGSEKKAK